MTHSPTVGVTTTAGPPPRRRAVGDAAPCCALPLHEALSRVLGPDLPDGLAPLLHAGGAHLVLVTAEGCLLWDARGDRSPQLHVRGARGFVTRLLWEGLHGPVPAGHCVNRTCGRRACVNPRHLSCIPLRRQPAVTSERGGFPVGQQHHAARLEEEDVRAVRAARHLTLSELASLYRVSRSAIAQVRARRTWRHV